MRKEEDKRAGREEKNKNRNNSVGKKRLRKQKR